MHVYRRFTRQAAEAAEEEDEADPDFLAKEAPLGPLLECEPPLEPFLECEPLWELWPLLEIQLLI